MENGSINYPKIRDILGHEKLQRVIGLVIYVPLKPNEDHILSRFIGVESTRKLSELVGGMMLYIPKFPNGKRAFLDARNQEIYKDRLAGLSYEELAEKYHLSTFFLKRLVTVLNSQRRQSGQSCCRFLPAKRRMRDENIFRDYQQGLSYKELSEKYCLSVSWIKSLLFRLQKKGVKNDVF